MLKLPVTHQAQVQGGQYLNLGRYGMNKEKESLQGESDDLNDLNLLQVKDPEDVLMQMQF